MHGASPDSLHVTPDDLIAEPQQLLDPPGMEVHDEPAQPPQVSGQHTTPFAS